MMEEATQHHISQQFNLELRELSNQVLGMGGLVEEQLNNALLALTTQDGQLAEQVYTNDYRINTLEVAIDEDCTRILARRQPTASDLRLVMAVIKIITDLERIGDEAERIARMSIQRSYEDMKSKYYTVVGHLGDHVREMLHNTLDAFARMDVEAALGIIHDDLKVDSEYENISRQLITYMMEDPRTIPMSLSILWSARALERIAAHSRNICEYIIYFVKGKDVRHISLEKLEQHAKAKR